MRFEFSAVLWRWEARTDFWTFVSVPEDASAEIAEVAETLPRGGFGAVRVDATVGRTRWRTSIFPVDGARTYSLAVGARVRRAEGLELGDTVRVGLELVDL